MTLQEASRTYIDTVDATVIVLNLGNTNSSCCALRVQFVEATKPIFDLATKYMEDHTGGILPTTRGPEARKARDKMGEELKLAMTSLSNDFKDISFSGDCGYDNHGRRLGYLLKYTIYNSLLGACVMRYFDVPALVQVGPVVSIGGGPGTDWFALQMTAHSLQNRDVHVFDLPFWGDMWQSEDHLHFHGLDVTKDSLCPPTQTALFVFFYFMNEMVPHEAAFRPVFSRLVEQAKEGAVFVVLERTRESCLTLLDTLFEDNKQHLTKVVHAQRFEVELPSPLTNKVSQFVHKFSLKARVSGKTGVYIWKKSSEGLESVPAPI
eukprot:TRINITY_DN9508_c0_g1_i1.p1 TRINITY_DN9508_c0_g1~~TRINITY_DN9508_c0_g1_i1.p1  ORF type:complete len:321 (-),score=11.60 TRINITY_DN9508_c0_g1_i1:21-983(-)